MVPTVTSILSEIYHAITPQAPPEFSSIEAVMSEICADLRTPGLSNASIAPRLQSVYKEFKRVLDQNPLEKLTPVPELMSSFNEQELCLVRTFQFLAPWVFYCLDQNCIDETLHQQTAVFILVYTCKNIVRMSVLPAGLNEKNMLRDLITLHRQSALQQQQVPTFNFAAPLSPPPISVPCPSPTFTAARDTHYHCVATPKSDSSNAPTHELLPRFAGSFCGPISLDDRTKAWKAARQMPSISPFKGTSDSRPLRRVLSYIRELTEAHGLSPLMYSALLDSSLGEEVRVLIPSLFASTYEQLIDVLATRLSHLLATYSGSVESERTKVKGFYLAMRMRATEKLSEYITRFETCLVDLRSVGQYPSADEEIITHFICSIIEEHSANAELCRALHNGSFGLFKTTLLGMSERAQARRRAPLQPERPARPESTVANAPYNQNRPRPAANISNTPQAPVRATPTQAFPSGNRTCAGCGGFHPRSECPHQDAICSNCSIKGHIPAVCRQGQGGRTAPTHRSSSQQQAHAIELQSLTTKAYTKSHGVSTINNISIPVYDDQLPHLEVQLGSQADTSIPILLDTGASDSFIDEELLRSIPGAHKSIPGRRALVTFADGSTSSSHGQVELEVRFQQEDTPRTELIKFWVLPRLHRKVLLGRSGLSQIGLSLGYHQPLVSSAITPTSPLEIGQLEAQSVLDEIENHKRDELDLLYTSPSEPEFVRKINEFLQTISTPRTEQLTSASITRLSKALLAHLTNLGWFDIAEGYQLCIQPCDPSELRDTSSQTFKFVVRWTVKDPDPSVLPWNSIHLIKKLTKEEYSEWSSGIQSHIKTGWYHPIERPSENPLPTATLFPVRQCELKSTKVRQCGDLRAINKLSPTVSAQLPSVSMAIWQLRTLLKPGLHVRQYDLQKAFLKIHTRITDSSGSNHPLTVRSGYQYYQSTRLLFGLTCGPHVLNSVLLVFRCITDFLHLHFQEPSVTNITVMDDLLNIGTEQQCAVMESFQDIIWELTGFDSPPSKRCTWSRTPSRWLGHFFSWDSQHLKIQRSSVTLALPSQWTKRAAFQVAGSYTASTCSFWEAMSRSHSDVIRSLSGTMGEWDSPITDGTLVRHLNKHARLAQEYWERSAKTETHLTLLHSITSLIITSDASGDGYGYVLTDEHKNILFAEGRLFKQTQQVWHSGRKELFGLCFAIHRVDTLLFGVPNVRHVTALTDSILARSHSSPFKASPSKALEKTVLLRLRNIIVDIISQWRRMEITFDVQHLKGTDNVFADALSRVRSPPVVTDLNSIGITQPSPLLTFPPFSNWLLLRNILRAWRSSNTSNEPIIESPSLAIRDFFIARQASAPDLQSFMTSDDPVQGEKFHYRVEDGLLTRKIPGQNPQVVIPDDLIEELIMFLHQHSGHTGQVGTTALFLSTCFHPKHRKLIKKLVHTCEGCLRQESKPNAQESYLITPPTSPFEVLGMDLYGPLLRNRGARQCQTKLYVLTIVCKLTGYTYLNLLPNSKEPTVRAAFENLLWKIGSKVRLLITDNGKQFTGSLRDVCTQFGIRHHLNVPYTPHQGGFFETRHRIIGESLRSTLVQYPVHNWKTLIQIAQARINSHVGRNRTHSPHQLIFGWKYVFPFENGIANSCDNSDPNTLITDPEDPFTISTAQSESSTRNKERSNFLKIWNEDYHLRQVKALVSFQKSHPPTGLPPLKEGDKVYLINNGVRYKFASRNDPITLKEQLHSHIWIAEDSMEKRFKVHIRNIFRPPADDPLEHGPETEEAPDTSADQELDEVARRMPLAAKPPETRKARTLPPEQGFLASIRGSSSKTGRIRRGRNDDQS